MMKQFKIFFFSLLSLLISIQLFSQIEVTKIKTTNGEVSIRETDVHVPVNDISSSPWDELACLEDPDSDSNDVYGGILGKDANKLRTIPYTTDNASGNSTNNHTFWFSFGCCGDAFCVDDNNGGSFTSGDGALRMPDVNTGYDTWVWVDFLTQCEDCQSGAFPGQGIWHKWEMEYDAFELDNAVSGALFPDFVDIGVMEVVDCFQESQYGCDAGEES
ncbi:MAG: hypothetical protein ACJAT4_000836 [Granulosicoccus sp.]|jgi:hypothetical protein